MDELIGKTFGPYKILEKIGEGGMGVVYRGLQESLNRYVAIKVLRGELAHDEQFIARFRREALAVAKLSHPNILQIFDAGAAEGMNFIVMDYVDGGSLKDLIRKGPIEPRQAASIAAQMAEALDYAHEKGLIHRDVKPANVLLDRGGRPLLTDFGIARALYASTRLTRTGTHIGTPEYMAPEQAQGEPADGRTDIYALGIVLYEMLTGKVPFSAHTPMATLYKQVNEPLRPVRAKNPSVPAWLETIVDKALAKRPRDRYQRASDLATALRKRATAAKAVPPPPPRRRPDAPAEGQPKRSLVPILIGAIGLLLLILLASGGFLLLRDSDGKQDGAGTAGVVTRVVLPEEVVTKVVTPEAAATVVVTAPSVVTPAADTPLPEPTETGLAATAQPTITPQTPADTPTAAPPATSTRAAQTTAPTTEPPPKATEAACPGWYAPPQPGHGVLLVENHIGEELQVEQIQGGSDQWQVTAKQGETPGRLLLQLPPGDHEFVLYVASGGKGHIKLKMGEGQQFVSPVWFNYRYDEFVYPLETPPGCN
jgi:predicted Ser/Thr protein kinase